MRLLWVLLIAACLGAAACNSTGKKPSNNNTPKPQQEPGQDSSNPFWGNSTNLPRNSAPPMPSSEYSGILAGSVFDSSGTRPLPGVVVNFTEASAPPGSAPKGMETDGNGVFMIRGLKPDVMYRLTFRADDKGHVLGATAHATPPNSHMVVRVSEDNVSAITPPPEPHPGATGPFAPKDSSKDQPKNGGVKDPPPAKVEPPLEAIPTTPKESTSEGEDYAPGRTPPASRSFPPPPAARPAPGNNNVALDPSNPPTPVLNVPNIGPSVPSSPKYMEPPRPSSSAAMTAEAGPGHITQASAPTIMPGQRPKARLDFTLYDLSGRPWNFRNHSGKLVLVDFWATTCVHCIHAMPKVIELQSRYRQDGLEVVGIACEAPSDFVSQVTAVEKVKLRFADSKAPINYPMYLEGTNFEGRVQKLFGIRAYPTMILLDEYGRQLWRSDRKESTGLEEAIRYYLSK